MAKKHTKKQLLGRGVMLLLLAGILSGLCAGYVWSEKRAAAEPPAEPPAQMQSEPSELPAPESETEPETEPEPTAAAQPQKPKLDLPAASAQKPATVTPTGAQWALTPVNLCYRLPEDYTPELKPALQGSAVQLDARVAPYYQKMYDAAKADGCTLTPYSGYSAYSRQAENYNRKLQAYLKQGLSQAEATEKTQSRILPAGASEHNLGFSIDIVSASADFVSTQEFSWLCTHAAAYGFVLRYPENKTDITKMVYQPWHWRFVGETAAKEMQKKDLCLEEYLGISAS